MRDLVNKEGIKLRRNTHKVRYSDINETTSLPIASISHDRTLPKLQMKDLRSSKHYNHYDLLSIETTISNVKDDNILKKQSSRFLYEMHSESKIPFSSAHHKNPSELSRKRRIMELLTLNRNI
jgi:hypothetical protein